MVQLKKVQKSKSLAIKKKKLLNMEDYLVNRHGKKGSSERDKLEEETWTLFYGDLLRDKRKKLKLSQKEVAARIGKTRVFISQVETGRDVRLSNFVAIAHALNMNLVLKDIS